jgi:hypothetical protein
MSNNFGALIPNYITNSLAAPVLDVNASGLLNCTGQNSLNIRGPYAVILQTATLPVGTAFYVLNSSTSSQCSIQLDNGGLIGFKFPPQGYQDFIWTINYFPLNPSALLVFLFNGTNLFLR